MPWPGVTVIPDSRLAKVSLPCARGRLGLLLGDARRQLLADDAVEDDVGGVAEDLRSEHREHHADHAEQDDEDQPDPLRIHPAAAAAVPTGRSSATSPRACPCRHRTVRRRRARRGGGANFGRSGRGSVSGSSCRHLRSELGLDDLTKVGQVPSSSSWCRPRRPAVLQHDDLVGVGDGRHPLRDDDHRPSLVVGLQRGPQPGVGGQVQRRERVVEQVDVRARATSALAMASRCR